MVAVIALTRADRQPRRKPQRCLTVDSCLGAERLLNQFEPHIRCAGTSARTPFPGCRKAQDASACQVRCFPTGRRWREAWPSKNLPVDATLISADLVSSTI